MGSVGFKGFRRDSKGLQGLYAKIGFIKFTGLRLEGFKYANDTCSGV